MGVTGHSILYFSRDLTDAVECSPTCSELAQRLALIHKKAALWPAIKKINKVRFKLTYQQAY